MVSRLVQRDFWYLMLEEAQPECVSKNLPLIVATDLIDSAPGGWSMTSIHRDCWPQILIDLEWLFHQICSRSNLVYSVGDIIWHAAAVTSLSIWNNWILNNLRSKSLFFILYVFDDIINANIANIIQRGTNINTQYLHKISV